MLALLWTVATTPAHADADTDYDPPTTDSLPDHTAEKPPEDDDGCGGCALVTPTSVVSLGLGAALLVGIRRRRR